MNSEISKKQKLIVGVVINIISIFLVILNIYVFIQYKNGNTDYLTLTGILNLIDLFFLSAGKGFFFSIFCILIALFHTKNIWVGICLGLCFENIIMYILGILYLLFIFVISLFSKKDSSYNLVELNKAANQFALKRGFNSWNEFENAFIEENKLETNLSNKPLVDRLNYVAKTAGYLNYEDMFNAN